MENLLPVAVTFLLAIGPIYGVMADRTKCYPESLWTA